jgi:branched-chain amino acid transport system permease protein
MAIVSTAADRAARQTTFAFAFLVVTLAVAPFVVYPVFLMKALCFALFACAFNLLLGYVGLLSFGHAMFFGASAYAAAHAATAWGASPGFAILFGTLVGAALGAAVGALAIRRQGIYFAMITLGFAQMVYFLCVQMPWTGGENGLQGVPRGTLLWLFDLRDTTTLYYFVAAIFLAGFLIIYRTIHSPFGEVVRGIREHEPRMISLGYDVDRYKWLAFVLSAALAGLAGSTKAIVFQLASLTDVHWTTSGEVVLMTLLGGLGRVWGPLIGAVLLITLENYLGPLGGWFTVIQGAIFIVCVTLFRQGIVGEIERLMKNHRRELTGGS